MRLFAAALLLIPTLASAALPKGIGYQGRLLRADGAPEAGVVQATFTLYDVPSGGAPLWSENLTLGLVDGYYSVFLGNTSPLDRSILAGGTRYLELKVGGEVLSPRHELGSVPYAALCGDAQNVTGGTVEASSLTVGGKPLTDSSGKFELSRLQGCSNPGEQPTWGAQGWECKSDPTAVKRADLEACDSPGALLEWDGAAWACRTSLGLARLESCPTAGSLLSWDGSRWTCQLQPAKVDWKTLEGCASAGQILEWSGTGWACRSDLSTVAVAAPLSGDGSPASPVALAAASATTDGYLKAADFAALSSKVSSVGAGSGIAVTGTAADPVVGLGSDLTLRGTTTFAGKVVFGSQESAGFRFETASSAPVSCDAAHAGYVYLDTALKALRFCSGSSFVDLWKAAPPASCKAILAANPGASSGVYSVDPDGEGGAAAVEVYCDMTTDGGGWTVCARQSFASDGAYLGNAQLSSRWGSPSATGAFGADCVALMRAVRPNGHVEFSLKGSATGEWIWLYPFSTESFWAHLEGGDNANCNGGTITECKGSATSGKVSVSKPAACHSQDQHRTSDSYFIYQVADGQNSNVLLEIGQGDSNHPVGIRADCGVNGWWGGCGNPGGVNRAYAVPSQCGTSNRVQGTVSVMFRER